MKIVALAGGVGGAKLADGLAMLLPPQDLTIIVNTGDDFEHLGLSISPDLDTVCYTLAGLANPATGWGQENETYHMLAALAELGGETWFKLGDRDLATHLERTHLLQLGQTLSQVTQHLCARWQIAPAVLPMTNDRVRTLVDTIDQGTLSFQEYFVHRQCQPTVTGFRFDGIPSSLPAPGVLLAIQQATAIIICPSNPWVSIDPIMAIPGLRSSLKEKNIVAISPIIGKTTIKGPAAKMFSELGIQPSASAVADHYSGLLSGFLIDTTDSIQAASIPVPTSITPINMHTRKDRGLLAETVLNFIQTL